MNDSQQPESILALDLQWLAGISERWSEILPILLAVSVGFILILLAWRALRNRRGRKAKLSPEPGPVTADPRLQPETAERFEAPRILDPAEAARHLRATAATSALFLSPEEDEAASIAVRVAREVSDTGRRVVLLDLTVNAAASGPMLEGIRHDGITDLLAAEAQFTDIIHSDSYSDCDVIPTGNADPAAAMRNGDRLPIILQSLSSAYDLVVTECGAAPLSAIRRLAPADSVIFVSSTGRRRKLVEGAARDLADAGLARVTIVEGAAGRR